MFGWFKKRLATRMLGLADAAQMVISLALLEHCVASSRSESSEPQQIIKEASKRAGACANYLFGKETDSRHAQLFDMVGLHKEMHDWLVANVPFQELVIQSLRVLNLVAYTLHGTTPLIGEPILSEFGRDYPDTPNPATFEALVHRSIQLLPNKMQEDVRSWMKKTGR